MESEQELVEAAFKNKRAQDLVAFTELLQCGVYRKLNWWDGNRQGSANDLHSLSRQRDGPCFSCLV